MTEHSFETRLAIVEEKQDQMALRLTKLDEIHTELVKYKGFVGGILFISSSFWALLLFGKDWLKAKLGV